MDTRNDKMTRRDGRGHAQAGSACAGAAAVVLACSALSAGAASATWSGTTDGLWSKTANWGNVSPVPGSSNTATFNGSGNGNTVIDLGSGVTLNTLLFDTAGAAAYTIGTASTNTLTINNTGKILMAGPVVNSQAIDATVAFQSINNTISLVNNAADSSAVMLVRGGIISTFTGAQTVKLDGSNTGMNIVSGVINKGSATTMALTKLGAGAWILNNANTYNGATTVQEGTLKLDFSGVNAPANNIISSGSTLIFGGTTGCSTLWVAGKADTTNTQTFSGFTVNAGAGHLKLTTEGTGTLAVDLGILTSTSGRNTGATLDISLPASGVTLRSTATNNPAGVLFNQITLNGTDFASTDTANNYAVKAFTGYVQNTATTLGSSFNHIIDMTNGNTTVTGATATTLAGLRFNTAADTTITLTGTTAGAKALAIGGGNTAGAILVTPNVGANLCRITGSTGIVQGISSRDLVILQNNPLGDLQIDSVVTDFTTNMSALTKSGVGRLVLTAGNAYQGITYLNEGTIVVSGDATTGNSQTLTTNTASNTISGVDTTGLFVGQRVYGTNITGKAAGTYIVAVSGSSVTLNDKPSASGSGTVTFGNGGGLGIKTGDNAVLIGNGATLQIGNDGSTGSLVANQNITNNGTVVFRRSDGALVFSNTISGLGGVTQAGSGMVTLSALNSYTGSTLISSGTLVVSASGSLGATSGIRLNGGELKYNSSTALTSPLTLTSGKISGTGAITTAVSVGSGVVLSPGNSPGSQTFSSLAWTTGGAYLWEINDQAGTEGANPGWDVINVTGAFDISALSSAGPFSVNITGLDGVGTAPATETSWTILRYGSLTGSFDPSLFSLDATGFDASWTGTWSLANKDSALVLTYSTVPEPAMLALLGLGGLALLRRRRG